MLTIFRRAAASDVEFEIATRSEDLVQYAFVTAITCMRENSGVTLALQAYLNRTEQDLLSILRKRLGLRLVKGAYSLQEPS